MLPASTQDSVAAISFEDELSSKDGLATTDTHIATPHIGFNSSNSSPNSESRPDVDGASEVAKDSGTCQVRLHETKQRKRTERYALSTDFASSWLRYGATPSPNGVAAGRGRVPPLRALPKVANQPTFMADMSSGVVVTTLLPPSTPDPTTSRSSGESFSSAYPGPRLRTFTQAAVLTDEPIVSTAIATTTTGTEKSNEDSVTDTDRVPVLTSISSVCGRRRSLSSSSSSPPSSSRRAADLVKTSTEVFEKACGKDESQRGGSAHLPLRTYSSRLRTATLPVSSQEGQGGLLRLCKAKNEVMGDEEGNDEDEVGMMVKLACCDAEANYDVTTCKESDSAIKWCMPPSCEPLVPVDRSNDTTANPRDVAPLAVAAYATVTNVPAPYILNGEQQQPLSVSCGSRRFFSVLSAKEKSTRQQRYHEYHQHKERRKQLMLQQRALLARDVDMDGSMTSPRDGGCVMALPFHNALYCPVRGTDVPNDFTIGDMSKEGEEGYEGVAYADLADHEIVSIMGTSVMSIRSNGKDSFFAKPTDTVGVARGLFFSSTSPSATKQDKFRDGALRQLDSFHVTATESSEQQVGRAYTGEGGSDVSHDHGNHLSFIQHRSTACPSTHVVDHLGSFSGVPNCCMSVCIDEHEISSPLGMSCGGVSGYKNAFVRRNSLSMFSSIRTPFSDFGVPVHGGSKRGTPLVEPAPLTVSPPASKKD